MADIREELLEELLKDFKKPDDLPGKGGILRQLEKRLREKAMQ